MEKYTHLTEAQRYYIYLMKKQGLEIGARFTLNCVSFLMRLWKNTRNS